MKLDHLIQPMDTAGGSSEKKTGEVYVLKLAYQDGRADAPVYVEKASSDADEQLRDALAYFREKFRNQATVSVTLAGDFGEAGVSNIENIQPWGQYRDGIFHFDKKNRADKLLMNIQSFGASARILEALQQDFRTAENEQLFLKYIDTYIADAMGRSGIIKALMTSKKAHTGATQKRQKDQEGADFIPYVNHPIRVATMALKDLKLSAHAIEAALLHDVVEDTSTTFEDLEKDFPPQVIEILRDVTRAKEESRESYMKRTKELGGVSKLIKCLDRFHNLLRAFTINDIAYLERYIRESKEVYLPEFLQNPVLGELAIFFNHLIEELEKYKEKLKTKVETKNE